MRFLFSLLIGLATFNSISAQPLKIKVNDSSTGNHIELATVALYIDSIFYQGKVTDNNGIALFENLPQTQFRVKASSMGFETAETTASKEHELTLQLTPSVKSLSEVNVEGNRQAFTSSNGTITFNPSFIPDAMNAAQIVSSLPGVVQDNNRINMIGKSGIIFYINGRRQKGSTEQLMQQFLSFSARDVEKVEIIIEPTGKYTTIGNNGAINIILKKQPNNFLGGNLSAEAKYTNLLYGNAEAGIIYKTSKLQTTFNITGTTNRANLKEYREYIYPGVPLREENALLKRRQKDLSARLTLNYDFSAKWNGEIQAYYMPAATEWNIYTDYSYPFESSADKSRFRQWQSNNSDTWFAGGSATGKLRDNLWVEGSLDYFYQDNPYKGNNLSITTHEYQWVRESGLTNISVLPKVNFTLSLPRSTSVNFGVDFTHTNSHDQSTGISQYTVILPEEDFRYKETVGSFYASASTKLISKLSVRGALNYEYAWIEGKSHNTESSDFSKKYGWLATQLSFTWRFSQGKNLTLGFYDNIVRPSIAQLNPTTRYIGSYSYRKGDPELKAQTHYMTSLNFTAGQLTIMPFIEWLKGGIEDVISVVDQNKTLYSWENSIDRTTYAIQAYYYKSWSRFRLSINAFAGYDHYKSLIASLPDGNGVWGYRITPSAWLFIDRQRRWTVNISGNYNSRRKTGTLTVRPEWYLNARISWKATDALSLSLSATNLWASHTKGATNNIGYSMHFDNTYAFRGIALSASFNWGVPMGYIWQRDAYRTMKERTQRDL